MEEERLVSDRSRQYGSCARRAPRTHQPHIRHPVRPGDTLQGLALKYLTTTEKIRLANRLFATDSLFLREYLIIPISEDYINAHPEKVPSGSNIINHRASVSGISNIENQISFGSPDEKEMFNDFLSRVDTSLASIKKDVERTSEKSEFGRYSAELYTRRKPTSRLRQSTSLGGVGTNPIVSINSDDNCHGTETVVLAEGRHIRSSLQRLQRTQDDWFQL